MIRFIVRLLPLLTFFSCSKQSPHVVEAHRVMSRHIEDVEKDGKVFVFGTGGAMMDDIQMLALNFFSYETLDVNQARRLIVNGIESLLERVNNDPKIRPYLHDYPFTVENLRYGISFRDSNIRSLNPPYIAFVFTCNKDLHYKKNDPVTNQYVDDYEESYEEALAIVRGERAE
jgi:hypothetical protein